MTTNRPMAGPTTIAVTVRGEVPSDAVDDARNTVERVLRHAGKHALAAHVVLVFAEDSTVPRPARAEVSLDVDGTLVRAHSAAPDLPEAVDLLEERLRQNLVQLGDRVRTRHRWIGVASEHEWRHGDLATHREAFFPRAPEDREVVRRKTFALGPMTPDEAAFEMDLLGHDFYLFTDLRSGKDAVVYRDDLGTLSVRGDVVVDGENAALLVRAGAAPTLTEPEAKERLELTGDPFMFYLEPGTGRGRVLYLRYDGHYGVIAAADR